MTVSTRPALPHHGHRPSPAPSRDVAVDVFRSGALAVVVLGHWLLTVVHWRDEKLFAANLLELEPATQWSTWLFQPMPLFFTVGGWAAAASWDADRTRRPCDWVSRRLARLLGPAVRYAAVALVVAGVLGVVVPEGARAAGGLLGMHLWFLAVFVPVSALSPWLAEAVRRHGWRVPLSWGAAVVIVDLLRFHTGAATLGWANFAFVWLVFTTLGMAVYAAAPRRLAAGAVAVLSGVLLVVVVGAGWYDHSMVGVGERSNNTPPTVALALLGVVQSSVALLAAPRVRAALMRRGGLRRAIGVLGALGLHLYLWHLCATLVVVAGMRATGWGNLEPLSGGWWATRPLWLVALAIVAAPIVVGLARVDRRRLGSSARPGPTATGVELPEPAWWRLGLVVLLAVAGLAQLSLHGMANGPASVAAVLAVHGAARMLASTRSSPLEGKPPWSPSTSAATVGP